MIFLKRQNMSMTQANKVYQRKKQGQEENFQH